MLLPPSEVLRSVGDFLLAVAGGSLLQSQVLGMPERKHEKQTLRVGEGAVHPGLDPFESEPLGGEVLSVGYRGAPIHAAGELVQDDDQREPPARRVRPRVQLSPSGLLQYGGELLGYLFIDLRSSAKPPHGVPAQRLGIGVVVRREPIGVYLFGIAHDVPLPFPTTPSRGCSYRNPYPKYSGSARTRDSNYRR